MDRLTHQAQSTVLLFLRLLWGVGIARAGWAKWGDMAREIAFFEEKGIPYATLSAWSASIVQGVGGPLLVLGFATRLVSLPLTVTMAVAFFTVHSSRVFSPAEGSSFYYELATQAPVPYLLAFLVTLVFGAGDFSLDHQLFGRERD